MGAAHYSSTPATTIDDYRKLNAQLVTAYNLRCDELEAMEAERDRLLAAVGHEVHKFDSSGEAVDAAITWIEDRRHEATDAMTDAHRLREALEDARTVLGSLPAHGIVGANMNENKVKPLYYRLVAALASKD